VLSAIIARVFLDGAIARRGVECNARVAGNFVARAIFSWGVRSARTKSQGASKPICRERVFNI